MAGEGLYRMHEDGGGAVVIDLLGVFGADGDGAQAVLTGPGARPVFEHFASLTDKAQADAFAYGVVMGLRYAAEGAGKIA